MTGTRRGKPAQAQNHAQMERIRIDKWLWAARLYKTRSLACMEVNSGRVEVNAQTVKPSREIKAGDTLQIRQGDVRRVIVVQRISDQRGPAPVAQQLYRETEESILLRERAAEQRRLTREPARSIEHGRPTKRDRRTIEIVRSGNWNE